MSRGFMWQGGATDAADRAEARRRKAADKAACADARKRVQAMAFVVNGIAVDGAHFADDLGPVGVAYLSRQPVGPVRAAVGFEGYGDVERVA